MNRSLDSLHPAFKPAACELLARFTEAGVPVMIIQTLRTQAEHEENLRTGHSWTKFSKHLVGLAIDICPYSVYDLHGPDKLQWNAGDPIWQTLGSIQAKFLPILIWGGSWTQKDLGHFEWPTWEHTR